jgi:hypothetical protein
VEQLGGPRHARSPADCVVPVESHDYFGDTSSGPDRPRVPGSGPAESLKQDQHAPAGRVLRFANLETPGATPNPGQSASPGPQDRRLSGRTGSPATRDRAIAATGLAAAAADR